MSIIEVIETLRKFNEWRRYDGQIGEAPEQPSPKEIGEAIDGAVELLSGKNNTTIEQIKAEVERRKKIYNEQLSEELKDKIVCSAYGGIASLIELCDNILSFLSTLQEQPVCEGLEEEINRFEDWMETYNQADYPTSFTTRDIARHFAKWQKEKDNEVADKALTTSIKLQEGWYAKGIADGEKSMKEQMMKEAVEGEVIQDLKDVNRVKSFGKVPDWLRFGDKVRIFIVKEEGK